MKNKIVFFILIILVICILIIGIKICNRKILKYDFKEYNKINDYDLFIENNINPDRDCVIKLKEHKIEKIYSTLSTYCEIYIDTSTNTIYGCSTVSGCANTTGDISIGKISQELINKILSLKNENLEAYKRNNSKTISYWTLEYQDKEIEIRDIPKEIYNIFK